MSVASNQLERELMRLFKDDDLASFISILDSSLDLDSLTFGLASLAFAYAAWDILDFLLKSNISFFKEDRISDLQKNFLQSCQDGNLSAISDFLANGYDFHESNQLDFCVAVINDQLEVVDYLIRNNAVYFGSTNRHSRERAKNILHEYIAGHFEVIPDFDLSEEYKENVTKAKNLINFLLDRGYDINQICKNFHLDAQGTPLDIALCLEKAGTHELIPLIEFMRKKGAKTEKELGENKEHKGNE